MEILGTFLQILFIILVAIGSIIVYNLLNKYLLSKIKINKWVVLVLSIVMFFLANAFGTKMPPALTITLNGVFLILTLWFVDLLGLYKRREVQETTSSSSGNIKRIQVKTKKKKDDVIRPKAKPNRVKKNK